MLKKKLIALACIAFFITSPFFAKAQLHLGASVGANLNHADFQQVSTWSPGGNAGFFATYDLSDFLFLNSGVSFSQIGGGYDSGYYYVRPDVFRQKVRITFNAVNVPLYVSATLPSLASSSVRPLLMVGAEYSYSLQTMESYENVYPYRGGSYASPERSRSSTTFFEAHQPAMLFGAGVSLNLFGMPGSIDLRYRSNFEKLTLKNGEQARLKTLSLNLRLTLIDL